MQPLDAASEQLCLVDQNDEVIGHLAKDACHLGAGVRHRVVLVCAAAVWQGPEAVDERL